MASINGVYGVGHAVEVITSRGQAGRFGTLRVTGGDAARIAEIRNRKQTLTYSGPLRVKGVRRTETFVVEIVETARHSPIRAFVQFQQSGPLAAPRILKIVPSDPS